MFYSFRYRCSTSLVKFIPRYVFLFGGLVKTTVLLISHSVASLLVYRNATNFCALILYPMTFLNSCISSSHFFWWSLGFSIYSIMSSANSESFTSSLPIWMPFIPFSCLIAVARMTSAMLNERSENGHLCLVTDFRGEVISFSALSMILVVGFL